MKKNILFFTIFLLGVFTHTTTLSANDNHQHKIYTAAGMDYAIGTLSMGYSYTKKLSKINRNLTIYTDVTQAMAEWDFNEYRIRIGAGMDTVQWKNWKLPVYTTVLIRGMSNNLVNGSGVGTELSLRPGYYGRIWTFNLDLVWDAQWATHLQHSSYYKTYIYEDVKDGWYSSTAYSLRCGFNISAFLFKHMELALNGGFEYHGQYSLSYIPPLYAMFSIAYVF